MPLGAPITQAITNGLGLAVEVVSARRQKSKQPAVVLTETTLGSSPFSARETDPPVQQEKDITEPLDHGEVEYLPAISDLDIKDEDKYHDAQESPTEEDEQNWALDDAANALEQPVSEESRQLSENNTLSVKYGVDGQPSLDSLVAIVLSKCPPITYSPPRLERPVIIPQRRPGEAGRGFIRAYAPVLAESGIPQETFISFLKTFHRASQASPVLGVIYISAGIVGIVPHTATLVTSIVVQVAVGAAIELQKRQRSNSFLDEMNEKIFRPRGKYALIMTYKPDATKAVQGKETDISEMVYKRSTKDGFKFAKGKFKRESGTTYAEVNVPESAPLVFPGLEQQSTELGQIHKVSSGKQSQKFLADYYDRRAQAIYVSRCFCPDPPKMLTRLIR
jgi:hypothetical protein